MVQEEASLAAVVLRAMGRGEERAGAVQARRSAHGLVRLGVVGVVAQSNGGGGWFAGDRLVSCVDRLVSCLGRLISCVDRLISCLVRSFITLPLPTAIL